jgi:hypothetical protein
MRAGRTGELHRRITSQSGSVYDDAASSVFNARTAARVHRQRCAYVRPPVLILAWLSTSMPLAGGRGAERWTIGLTTDRAGIEALAVAGATATSPTVLLIGGVEGKDRSADAVAAEVAAFEALPQDRRRFRLLAIPIANPDAHPLQFPPAGSGIRGARRITCLWRWIGTHAPDAVLIAVPMPGSPLRCPRTSSPTLERSRRDASTWAQTCSARSPNRSSRPPLAGTWSAGWRGLRANSPRNSRVAMGAISASRPTSPRWRSSAGSVSENRRRGSTARAVSHGCERQLRAPVAELARRTHAVLRAGTTDG